MCACVLVWFGQGKMPKAFGLGLGLSQVCTWLSLGACFGLGLGPFKGLTGWAPSHSLLLSLGPLSSSQALALDTIHPWLLALVSPSSWPPFRVGFAGELLPVSGYAWTPRSWETVVASSLGLG